MIERIHSDQSPFFVYYEERFGISILICGLIIRQISVVGRDYRNLYFHQILADDDLAFEVLTHILRPLVIRD